MQIPGIVGGIGPESTVDYYRSIVAAWRVRRQDGSYPPLLVNSIDMQRMLALAAADLAALADFLAAEVERLARAGADFALFSANTPHLAFDAVARRSPIPLVSIVEAACTGAQRLGLRRLALLGTRFTMEGRFYPDVFARAGLALAVPDAAERTLVHARYMDELVKGIFRPETRDELIGLVARMRARDGIDGVVLAGTELPLLLRGADAGVPLLDTTRLHVEAVVARMLDGP
jgi:aspartate racemase